MRSRIVIAGGGLGGVAAALAAARRGEAVVLLEELGLLGGQLTAQAVPADEHPWIEGIGCTESYRELRDLIRSIYRDRYPLNLRARRHRALNIGNATVSKISHEPSVAKIAIDTLLAPYLSNGLVTLRLFTRVVSVHVEADRAVGVSVQDLRTGSISTIELDILIDATEGGDILALADIEHVTGSESRSETGEPHARIVADPGNVQAATWTFAIEHRAGEDHTIDRPENYADWANDHPKIWPGPLLGFSYPDPRSLRTVTAEFRPNCDTAHDLIVADQSKLPAGPDLWTYRRALWRYHFENPPQSDVTLVNWPMNDYFRGPIIGGSPETDAHHQAAAKELSRSLLYWLQTDAPRADGGTGWPGLRLRPDITMSDDGFAISPYIREARRIRAMTTVVEQDISYEIRGEHGAVAYRDSVGIGAYRIDLHPSTGGDTFIDIATTPFYIPLGALVPVRIENVIPAAKNIGTTHITNGCYRLHPVEWNIGEAAAVLAIHALRARTSVQLIYASESGVTGVQEDLQSGGVELRWPDLRGY